MEPHSTTQDLYQDHNIDKKKDYRDARSRKKENAKALQVLGIDPSLEKLESSLGIEQEELRSLMQDNLFSYHQELVPYHNVDKKKNRKAYEVLGYDPSLIKIMNYFGFEVEEQVFSAVEESSPNTLLFEPVFEPVINKKDAQKACKVLGYDPSLFKLIKMFGVDPYHVNKQKDELVAEYAIAIM